MKSYKRMQLAFSGENADRRPFVPSIYEHGAMVIGATPTDAATSAELMAKSATASYEAYGHDLITVGIDIYNIESEAFGCPVKYFNDNSIPAIDRNPLADNAVLDSSGLSVPAPSSGNRLGLIAEASRIVYNELHDETVIYACMSGPFSQAVELRGFENLLIDMLTNPGAVHELLKKTSACSLAQAKRLSKEGVGVNIYESWATLPLISPEIFREYIVPYEKYIVSELKKEFATPAPAVILGGDTVELIDFFLDIETSLVVADYMTDVSKMMEKIRTAGSSMVIRGCLDPKMIERGDWEHLTEHIASIKRNTTGLNNFVWGCGCVTYNTTCENVMKFKNLCLNRDS